MGGKSEQATGHANRVGIDQSSHFPITENAYSVCDIRPDTR
jgi:hypothetical protein